MAALQTLAQAMQHLNLRHTLPRAQPETLPNSLSRLRPRRGVVVLYGYGISVRIERGHLIVESGVGNERHHGRFPRIGHGLERLIVIGADGMVSLSALRWLADQNAAFIMLERDGTVLATTGPVRPSDIRLRRAQAMAHQTGAAFRISRELIDRKFAGQERVARDFIRDDEAAAFIHVARSELAAVESIDTIRALEARAAKAYWKSWRSVPINFPQKDLPRVPEHWRSFGARVSPLTGSPRLAANPVNAVMNYLYALLEAECRLAVAALGLDPGMGVLHMDTPNRDSFACDLMETIRPDVDTYVFNWLARQPLKRSWFFEERNGNCRLTPELALQLAETAPTWARLIAPVAEWVVREIGVKAKTERSRFPTRLTQNHKRALTGSMFPTDHNKSATPHNVCGICGSEIRSRNEQCQRCSVETSTQRLAIVAPEGRIRSHSAEAASKRSRTQIANNKAIRRWSPLDQPSWLTEEFYVDRIRPLLSALPNRSLVSEIGVSPGYGNEIRGGRLPHPRLWLTLARLTGVYPNQA